MIQQFAAVVWLTLSPVAGDELREELAAADHECQRLRERELEETPAMPAIYERIGEIQAELGDLEGACQSYARCAAQTVPLKNDPVLAEVCLNKTDLCSGVPWLWQHRADYHTAVGLLARDHGDLLGALEAFRVAERDAASQDRKVRAIGLQYEILDYLGRPDEMAELEHRLVDPWIWQQFAPTREPPPRPVTSCLAKLPEHVVALRFVAASFDDVAFTCIRRKALGHTPCDQDWIATLKRVHAVWTWWGHAALIANTVIHLAWAEFLAGEHALAADLIQHTALPSDPEGRVWFHGLRMKLSVADASVGDWRDELASMDAAAKDHGKMESRWLALVWRGEALRARGDIDAALAAFLAAEDILDKAPLSLGFGAARQGYFAYYDLSLRNLVDLLHVRQDPLALLDVARRAVRRPGNLLMGLRGAPILGPGRDWQGVVFPGKVHTTGPNEPPRPGVLELAVVPGLRQWFAVVVDQSGAASIALGRSVDEDLSELTNSEFLRPITAWIEANEVIHPLLPGRANTLPLASLEWDGALLSERRRIVYIVETREEAPRSQPDDAAIVGVFSDDTRASQASVDVIDEDLKPLEDSWRVLNLMDDPTPHNLLVQAMPSARLLVLYATELRATMKRWATSDDWDAEIPFDDGPRLRMEDVLGASSVPELVFLVSCESSGQDDKPGLLDGLAPLFALRGSRWSVGVTGKINACVARQFLAILSKKIDASVNLDVSRVVQRARTELLATPISCPGTTLRAELARIVVFESSHLP